MTMRLLTLLPLTGVLSTAVGEPSPVHQHNAIEPRCANHTHSAEPYHGHSFSSGVAGASGFSTKTPIYPTSPVGTGSPRGVSNSSTAGAIGFSSSSLGLSGSPYGYYTPSSGSVTGPFPTANLSSIGSLIPLSTGGSSGSVPSPLSTGGGFSIVSASPFFPNSSIVGPTGSTAGAIGATSSSSKSDEKPKTIGTASYYPTSPPFFPTGDPGGSVAGPHSTGGRPSIASASPFFPNSSIICTTSNSASMGKGNPTGTAPFPPTSPGSTAGALSFSSPSSAYSTSTIPKHVSPPHGPYTASPSSLSVSSTAGAVGLLNGTTTTLSPSSITGTNYTDTTFSLPSFTHGTAFSSPSSVASFVSSTAGAASVSSKISYNSSSTAGVVGTSSSPSIWSYYPYSFSLPTSPLSSTAVAVSASPILSFNLSSTAGAVGTSSSPSLWSYYPYSFSLPTPTLSSTVGAISASPTPSFNLSSTAGAASTSSRANTSSSTAGAVGPSSSFPATSNSSSSTAGAVGVSSTSSIPTTFATSTLSISTSFKPSSFTKSEPTEYFWHHRRPRSNKNLKESWNTLSSYGYDGGDDYAYE